MIRTAQMSPDETYAALTEAYIAGNAGEILAAEYAYLLALAARLTEWRARTPVHEGELTLLERIAALIPDQLPQGAAPTLRDTLHALDLAFAGWQAESEAWQRWQARMLATLSVWVERAAQSGGER